MAWNTEYEDMLAFSGCGQVHIKTADFPLFRQKLPGFVVGFTGSKVFCLTTSSMTTVDVPHAAALHRYLGRSDFENAHKVGIAALDVTMR